MAWSQADHPAVEQVDLHRSSHPAITPSKVCHILALYPIRCCHGAVPESRRSPQTGRGWCQTGRFVVSRRQWAVLVASPTVCPSHRTPWSHAAKSQRSSSGCRKSLRLLLNEVTRVSYSPTVGKRRWLALLSGSMAAARQRGQRESLPAARTSPTDRNR